MADTTTHLGLPKPNRTRVPSRNIDEEFDALAMAWDMVDAFLHALAQLVAQKAPAEHDQAMSTITGLIDALNAKMSSDRQFALDDLTDVEGAAGAPTNYVLVKSSGGLYVPSSALAALGVHPHLIAEVTGLAAALTDRPTRAEVAEGLEVLNDDLMAEIQKRGVSVGTLEIFPINEVPLTNLVCDGSVFNEELYPQLYDYLGTNVLPNYTDRVLRMAGPLAGAAGTTQEDAMQRITGSFDVRATDTAGASFVVAGAGAFTRGPSTLPNHGGSSTGTARPVDKISFDSGLSPGARVNNNESRVKAGIVVITIRAFSNIVIDGMADLSALLTAIADKLTAEAGLDNTKLMTSLRTWQQGAARDARVLHVRDQKAAGAAGGSSVTGVQVRTLNTVVVNGIAGASLAANQITLPPGVYDINATSQFFRSGFGQLSIREAGGSYLLDGPQLYSIASGDYAAVNATVKGRIQLATTTVIELALYTHSSYATGGLGASNGVNTRPSIFSDVIIERVD